jgi:hypothetical protein
VGEGDELRGDAQAGELQGESVISGGPVKRAGRSARKGTEREGGREGGWVVTVSASRMAMGALAAAMATGGGSPQESGVGGGWERRRAAPRRRGMVGGASPGTGMDLI